VCLDQDRHPGGGGDLVHLVEEVEIGRGGVARRQAVMKPFSSEANSSFFARPFVRSTSMAFWLIFRASSSPIPAPLDGLVGGQLRPGGEEVGALDLLENVLLGDVGDFMAEHDRQLRLGVEDVEQTLGNEDEAAGAGVGVDGVGVEDGKEISAVGLVAVSGDVLSTRFDVAGQRRIGRCRACRCRAPWPPPPGRWTCSSSGVKSFIALKRPADLGDILSRQRTQSSSAAISRFFLYFNPPAWRRRPPRRR